MAEEKEITKGRETSQGTPSLEKKQNFVDLINNLGNQVFGSDLKNMIGQWIREKTPAAVPDDLKDVPISELLKIMEPYYEPTAPEDPGSGAVIKCRDGGEIMPAKSYALLQAAVQFGIGEKDEQNYPNAGKVVFALGKLQKKVLGVDYELKF